MRHPLVEDGAPSPTSHALTFDFGDRHQSNKPLDSKAATGPKHSRKYKVTSNSSSVLLSENPPGRAGYHSQYVELEAAASSKPIPVLNPVVSSRSLKPIHSGEPTPQVDPLPTFVAPAFKKTTSVGEPSLPNMNTSAWKRNHNYNSQSGRGAYGTNPGPTAVSTSLEGLPVDFRRLGVSPPPHGGTNLPPAADISAMSDQLSAKDRTLLPITRRPLKSSTITQNAYVFSSSPPPDKELPSKDDKRWATSRHPKPKSKTLQSQFASARPNGLPPKSNTDAEVSSSKHVDIQPSVISGKQWEFKMPEAPEVSTGPSEGGADNSSATANTTFESGGGTGEVNNTNKINARHNKSTQQRSTVNPHLRTQSKTMTKPVFRANVKGARQPLPSGSIFEMVVAGQHRLGTFDDDTATTYTLASLESAVARQRRLQEEIALVQKQVLSGFRSVVRTFIAHQSVHNQGTPLQDEKPTTQKTIKKGAFTFSIPLAKCSVVVHTLVTTIQRYTRFKHSNDLVHLLQKGDDKVQAVRSLASRCANIVVPLDASALLSSAPYTPSNDNDGGRSISSAWSDNLRHEEVLDSNTIAQLKQLYFAYYDCESYVLDYADDTSPTAKRLCVGGSDGDVHNVIEEANVLVAGFDEDEEQDDEEVIEEEGSMMFDEAKEWNQIYSDEDEHSTASSAPTDDTVPHAKEDVEETICEDAFEEGDDSTSQLFPQSAPKLSVFNRKRVAAPPPKPISPPRGLYSGSTTLECSDIVEETPVRTANGSGSRGFRSLRWSQHPSREPSMVPASEDEITDECH